MAMTIDLGDDIEIEAREGVTFKIAGEEVAKAWVDGDGYELECSHPADRIVFGDDDERGECPLCGSVCDWHWVKDLDEGKDENGNYIAKEIQVREIIEWHKLGKGDLDVILGEEVENIRNSVGTHDGKSES